MKWVSTHASAGDATYPIRRSGRSPCFNSRVRGGRDVMSIQTIFVLLLFQLTRPRGTRQDRLARSMRQRVFQLTRPRGTRQRYLRGEPRQRSFNSRVRGGRD